MVARSSVEAEFRAIAHGTCELIWIKGFLEVLRLFQNSPVKLFCDNQIVISIANNPMHHDRTKHVEVDKHFIKEKIESRKICLTHVPTSQHVADIFAKGLSKQLFEDFTCNIGMINMTRILRVGIVIAQTEHLSLQREVIGA